MVAVYLLLSITSSSNGDLTSNLLILIVSIIVLLFGVMMVYKAKTILNPLDTKLNNIVFPAVLDLFGLQGEWIQSQSGTELSTLQMDLLNDSLLLTNPKRKGTFEDTFEIDFFGRQLLIQELAATHLSKATQPDGSMFNGYFVAFELKTTLSHVTFVTTDSDHFGFDGHQPFWSDLEKTPIQSNMTELEWNDFENKLHVMTSDETEARYVLTPDFMADLYDWWKTKNQKIRIVFMDKRMYMLFPSSNIKIGRTINKLSEHELEQYVRSIATPLLHVFHLLEDVSEHL